MDSKEKKLWHYTTGDKLTLILESKVIKLATANLTAREKPAVWFSSNPIWEATCNKGLRSSITGIVRTATKEETERLAGGLARIRIKPTAAPYNFQGYRNLGCISNKFAKLLIAVAKERNAKPWEWFVSLKPVPESEWLDIEVWDGVKWKKYE